MYRTWWLCHQIYAKYIPIILIIPLLVLIAFIDPVNAVTSSSSSSTIPSQAAATAVGYFPWFLTYNYFNDIIPIVDPTTFQVQDPNVLML